VSLRDKHAAAGVRAPRKITLTVAGYEGDYFIRKITIGERSRYDQAALKTESRKGKVIQTVDASQMRERLLALCLVDATGKREYDDKDEEDLKFLASLPADVGEPLFEAAQEENGMSKQDSDELEELAGN
jgi:hypothetical protein